MPGSWVYMWYMAALPVASWPIEGNCVSGSFQKMIADPELQGPHPFGCWFPSAS